MSDAVSEKTAAPAAPSRKHGAIAFACATSVFAVVHFMGPSIAADHVRQKAAEQEQAALEAQEKAAKREAKAQEAEMRKLAVAARTACRKDKNSEACLAAPTVERRAAPAPVHRAKHGDVEIPVAAALGQAATLEVEARGGDLDAQLQMFANLMEQKKEAQAFHWLHRAAMQGHEASMLEIGRWHEEGHVVRQNLLDAYAWYANAKERGVASAGAPAFVLLKRMKPAEQRMADFRKRRLKDQLDAAAQKRGEPAGEQEPVDVDADALPPEISTES